MMKKFIAVLAVSAIVTTAAFAQATVNGMISWQADFMNNTGPIEGGGASPIVVGDDVDGIFGIGRHATMVGRFGMNVSNGEGTAGAAFRTWIDERSLGGNPEAFHGWVWWQPMDSLRIFAGQDPWAVLATNEIVGWSFNANNAEDVLLGGWGRAGGGYHYAAGGMPGGRMGRNQGFYTGFNNPGIWGTFSPMQDLQFIFGVPWGGHQDRLPPVWFTSPNNVGDNDPGSAHIGDWLGRSHIGVRYTIQGIGSIRFTYWGGHENQQGFTSATTPRLALSFLMTAVPGMQVNFGVVYRLPLEVRGAEAVNDDVEVGLGFLYSAGDLRFAARLGVAIPGDNDVFRIGLNVHPRFDVGVVMLHLNAGFQMNMHTNDGILAGTDNSDTAFAWHATPYISRTIAGPTRIFAGVHLESAGRYMAGDGDFVWRVPIGIQIEW